MSGVEKHGCPRPKCLKRIDNRLFCCAADWFDLSAGTRKMIGATAKMALLSAPRRRAIEAAMSEWRALDGASTGRR